MNERSSRAGAVGTAILLLTYALSVSGCLGRSPDVAHYMLGTGNASLPAKAEQAASVAGQGLAVLVGPVRLPNYLERPQIASLSEGGKVKLAEFSRWLGGFEANFLRSLSLGLARDLASIKVVAHPSSPPYRLDYRIRLHVDDLIFESDRNVLRARIRWALDHVGSETPAGLFMMEEALAVDGDSIEGRVEAHEAVIARLVSRIAQEIERIENPPEEPGH